MTSNHRRLLHERKYIILYGTALEPNLIGPTLPPIPPFISDRTYWNLVYLPVRQVLLELDLRILLGLYNPLELEFTYPTGVTGPTGIGITYPTGIIYPTGIGITGPTGVQYPYRNWNYLSHWS